MDRGHYSNKETHPRETANVLSLLSFFYTTRLFVKGYRNSLETHDLYEVLSSCRSKQLGDQLEEQWKVEKTKYKKPSICRAVWRCFGKRMVILGLLQLVLRVTITIWSPEALSKLISYFSPGQKEISKQDAIFYACVVIGLKVANLFIYYNYLLAIIALGLKVRTAIASLLYRKSLKINTQSLSEVTVGKITTIITKDVDSFDLFIEYGNDMLIALVQTAIICYLIYRKIGIASFAGVVFFFIILPLQAVIAKMGYNFRLKSSKKTDARLEIIQEVLSAIKIIKMYTWEKFFERKISLARKKELSKLHKLFYTRAWIVIIGSVSAKMGFFIFLMSYVWMGNNVTAEIVYYILSCFNNLEHSLSTVVPLGLSCGAEVVATAKRVENVLAAREVPERQEAETRIQSPKIIFSDVTVKVCDKSLFKNLRLSINEGLNIVVGHLGSGKSAFLKTILQENEVMGNLHITGTISYASQEPWLFPSTIKNNILFGEELHEERYREVLKVCSLVYDLETFVDGDDTVIGDHGINLSKGQQARISLARAVYKESDIYLLDDNLASLDARVSDNIFKECIKNFLKNKLCVFVTNNYDYIQEAKEILEIDGYTIKPCKKIDKRLIEDNNIKTTGANHVEKSTEKVTDTKEIYHETKKGGKVNMRIYYKYVSYGGGLLAVSLVMSLFLASQGVISYTEKVLSEWVTLEQNLSTFVELNQKNASKYEETLKNKTFYSNLYVIVAVTGTVLVIVRTLVFLTFTRFASINIHKVMIQSIINSTMTFFDNTFTGNILNRFSQDYFTVDESFPFILGECFMMVFIALGVIVLLTTVRVIFLIEALLLCIIAWALKILYQPTGRNLQRLNALTRSPMIGHLNSTLEGLPTIRASQAQEIIINEFSRHQNLYTSANFMLNESNMALCFSLELISIIFVTLVMVQFLVTDNDTAVGDVGMAITQASMITGVISSGIISISICENQMTSVERVLEYTEIEDEDKTGEFVENWPREGLVNFSHVSLSYNDTAKDMLKDVSFTINHKEKLGIVGRTGAGKSSVISSLFRLYKIDGKITIDGVDITNIPLTSLRSNISVIPQDFFLFSGTVRENLDPLKQYRDAQIWAVLGELKLKTVIIDLNMKINKGASFSAGQKQLFCLARAILRKNKIVVLDEATANVDQETDELIHEAVQTYFGDCTVIIIAHRLSSVLNCHKVAVLNKGKITEYDKPMELLRNKNSFLHSVIK